MKNSLQKDIENLNNAIGNFKDVLKSELIKLIIIMKKLNFTPLLIIAMVISSIWLTLAWYDWKLLLILFIWLSANNIGLKNDKK